jgi:hypothetical protein
MIRRRKLIAKRRRHGRAKPVPEWLEQESLELKVIWEYIGYDPPMNCRRTLDQFGHHSLKDTNSRDDDQMLYKLTKKDTPNNGPGRSWAARSLHSAQGSFSSMYTGTDVDFGIEPGSELKDGHVLMVDQLWLWSIDMSKLHLPGVSIKYPFLFFLFLSIFLYLLLPSLFFSLFPLFLSILFFFFC